MIIGVYLIDGRPIEGEDIAHLGFLFDLFLFMYIFRDIGSIQNTNRHLKYVFSLL